jgi:hypothetical protein
VALHGISENVTTTISSAGIYTHDFTTTADLSAIGPYSLMAVVVNNNPDGNTNNDTLKSLIKQLPNQPLNLTTAFKDDFETMPAITYENKTMGLPLGDRYDFENTTALGRLRSFINRGIAFSGNRALSLDIKAQSAAENVNYLTSTLIFPIIMQVTLN